MRPLQTNSTEFPRLARAALGQATLRRSLDGMRRAMPGIRAAALGEFPAFEAWRRRGREARDRGLADLARHLGEFEARVVAAGGEVHWARDAGEACGIVGAICAQAGARRVIKSKSMVTEEIGLNEHLARQGLQVTETDLGEYIIQLRGERPSHILAPALHLGLDDVGTTFERSHIRDRAGPLTRAEDMLSEAREELREIFLAADVGITGANFLVAEDGSVVIVSNEGNADLTAALPATHVVVTGIEKVVPTLEDLGALLRLLARSAIGEPLSAYTTLVNGARRPGDASGPGGFHVVLVDNGRSALVGTPLADMLRCIRCAACLNHCPVYTTIGGHAYGSVYSGPMGAVLTPALAGAQAAAHLPQASTLCGRCETVCPMDIPIPRMLRHWRERALADAAGVARVGLGAWAWLAAHPWLYRVALGLAARALRLVSVPVPGSTGRRVRRLPLVRGWCLVRDLPAPDGETFQQRWRRRGGATRP